MSGRQRQRLAKAGLRPVRVPESVEQAHIVQLLRSLGGRVYVMGTTRRKGDYHGTMQTEGIPDVMAFLPERDCPFPAPPTRRWIFLFIEAKAQGGRIRPEQAAFREVCVAANVRHIVGGFDAVVAELAAWGYVKTDSVPHYRQVLPAAPPSLDAAARALEGELQRRLARGNLRLVGLVDIGRDDELRARLAEACAGVAQPVVAVFETREI
jgi:hypothetical protein